MKYIIGLLMVAAFLLFGYGMANADMRTSTVKIMSGTGIGSGVIIGEHLIVTARHVVPAGPGTRVTVTFSDGTEEVGHVAALADGDVDVAAIVVDRIVGEAAKVACRDPNWMEPVTVVGFPSNIPYVATTGYIASVDTLRSAPYNYMAMLSAIVYHGNSGGPVFDSSGKVLGILNAMVGDDAAFGPGLMTPVNQFMDCNKKSAKNE